MYDNNIGWQPFGARRVKKSKKMFLENKVCQKQTVKSIKILCFLCFREKFQKVRF